MRFVLVSALVLFAGACTRGGDLQVDPQEAPHEPSLTGQLILPSGSGSRGVEILATLSSDEGESWIEWILFDDSGKFAHSLNGTLEQLEVTGGIGAELYRLDKAQLPLANQSGLIDFGTIDLRGQLMQHRMVLRKVNGNSPSDFRIGMWSGPPPTGVALGSRQFPERSLGEELEWLLTPEGEAVYFLVEEPDDSGRGLAWRGGRQHLFGPFSTASLPGELILD